MVKFGESISIIQKRVTFENISILDVYEKAIAVFRDYYEYEVIQEADRKKVEKIPEAAFREAIANSLIHRVWDVESQIRVLMFDDRIEVADMDKMVEEMVALRRGKMTADECRAALMKGNYFGTMLVKMGVADCLLGGATYSTADTVRPALQLIKTKPENKIVSSCFIMVREGVGDNTVLAMGDCAINIDPTEDELVEIGLECAKCAKTFGIDPKVAYLSYSTKGSGKGDTVDKMRNACAKAKAAAPELAIDGEMQFDAAVSPTVGQLKFPGSPVAGYANTFIFPNINAGNIGYKIAQRLGGFDAYGPILLGLNAPINDLSRGCNAQEVYSMAIITAALA